MNKFASGAIGFVLGVGIMLPGMGVEVPAECPAVECPAVECPAVDCPDPAPAPTVTVTPEPTEAPIDPANAPAGHRAAAAEAQWLVDNVHYSPVKVRARLIEKGFTDAEADYGVSQLK